MDGPTLANALRERLPHLPVLFMSGYSADGALLAEHADAETVFLAKPFTPAALASQVRALLDRAARRPSRGAGGAHDRDMRH